jgi:hypothetical protein
MRRFAERSRTTLLDVFRLLKALDAGALSPVPLHDYALTGDLTRRTQGRSGRAGMVPVDL